MVPRYFLMLPMLCGVYFGQLERRGTSRIFCPFISVDLLFVYVSSFGTGYHRAVVEHAERARTLVGGELVGESVHIIHDVVGMIQFAVVAVGAGQKN